MKPNNICLILFDPVWRACSMFLFSARAAFLPDKIPLYLFASFYFATLGFEGMSSAQFIPVDDPFWIFLGCSSVVAGQNQVPLLKLNITKMKEWSCLAHLPPIPPTVLVDNWVEHIPMTHEYSRSVCGQPCFYPSDWIAPVCRVNHLQTLMHLSAIG